jgi:hypothetical protein
MVNIKKIRNWAIALIIIFVLSPVVSYSFWWTTAWLSGGSPKWQAEIEDNYKKLSSKVLIKKLRSYNNLYDPACFGPYSYIALHILVERREKEAVPVVLKFLNSWDKGRRQTAIWALGVIGDDRAINPLMNIVKQGEKHPDYVAALSALSKMKYEGAFKYVIERSRKEDAYRNGSVSMLGDFSKPECIPLLLDMKSRIKDSDPSPKLGRSFIDDAIKHIESQNVKN